MGPPRVAPGAGGRIDPGHEARERSRGRCHRWLGPVPSAAPARRCVERADARCGWRTRMRPGPTAGKRAGGLRRTNDGSWLWRRPPSAFHARNDPADGAGVAPRACARHGVRVVVEAGQQDEVGVGLPAALANQPAELGTADPGHVPVGDHHRGPLALELRPTGLAVVGGLALMTQLGHGLDDQHPRCRLVFDHQDAHVSTPPRVPPGGPYRFARTPRPGARR